MQIRKLLFVGFSKAKVVIKLPAIEAALKLNPREFDRSRPLRFSVI